MPTTRLNPLLGMVIAGLGIILSPSEAQAVQCHGNWTTPLVRDNSPIEMRLDWHSWTSNDFPLSHTQAQQAVHQAMSWWNELTAAPPFSYGGWSYTEVHPHEPVDCASIGNYGIIAVYDGTCCEYLNSEEGCGCIAQGLYESICGKPLIVHFTKVNDSWIIPWHSYSYARSLQHELGHAYGVYHTGQSGNVMYLGGSGYARAGVGEYDKKCAEYYRGHRSLTPRSEGSPQILPRRRLHDLPLKRW
jgi:hypothetical protein